MEAHSSRSPSSSHVHTLILVGTGLSGVVFAISLGYQLGLGWWPSLTLAVVCSASLMATGHVVISRVPKQPNLRRFTIGAAAQVVSSVCLAVAALFARLYWYQYLFYAAAILGVVVLFDILRRRRMELERSTGRD